MNETTDLLQQAIQARIKGYNLIPLRGGEIGNENFKRPSIPWDKYQSDLSTITEIRQWYEDNHELRYGIVTGTVSKLFVVDLDSEESASAFFALNGDNAYIKIKTSRGWHVYYRWSDELRQKSTTRVRLKDKLDVRGEGGYVVAWDLGNLPEIGKLPPVPKWIFDLLPNRSAIGQALGNKRMLEGRDWLAEAFASLKVGNRNDTFTRIAGSLRSRGYSADTIFKLLKGTAQEVGFPLSELQTICASVSRYAPQGRSDAGDIGETKNFSEIITNRKPSEWIIQDIIPAEAIVFVAGLEGTGKSWLTADLAIEAAREHGLWLGRFPVRKSRVLYIEQERSVNETARRLAALASEKDIVPSSLNETLKVKLKAGVHIDDENTYNAFHRELMDYRPDLVIIDSFGTFTSLDPNSTREMQLVMERIKALRTEFKCTFVFVYHENKGAYERARDKKIGMTHEFMAGSSALGRAAETIFIVEGKGGKEAMCHQTKNNPGELGAPFSFTYENVVPDRSKIVVKAI